jgi:hypothetical protein
VIPVKQETLGTTVSVFARWLAQYSHLVCKLSLETPYVVVTYDDEAVPNEEEEHICAEAETMIRSAFSSAGAAANGLLSGLKYFKGKYHSLCSPAMLSSLPARSITSLELDMNSPQLAAPSMPRIFQQFSNLQKLDLYVTDSRGGVGGRGRVNLPAPFSTYPLSGLSNLKNLLLEVDTVYCNSPSLRNLPQSIETLEVNAVGVECLLDIQHLSSLRALHVNAYKGIAEGSSLPQSLLAATFLEASVPEGGHTLLSGLQQLTLTYGEDYYSSSVLLQLSALTGLQVLRFSYDDLDAAGHRAATWGTFPQLRALHFGFELGLGGRLGMQMYQAILNGLAKGYKPHQCGSKAGLQVT